MPAPAVCSYYTLSSHLGTSGGGGGPQTSVYTCITHFPAGGGCVSVRHGISLGVTLTARLAEGRRGDTG